MHPPAFRLDHLVSEWPECRLEVNCCRQVFLPLRMLAGQHGDIRFSELLTRLRCSACGSRPAPVYLCAGHREHCNGAPADWAIELVSAREAPR